MITFAQFLEGYVKEYNPKLVIVLGGPGAGKTYIAKMFAANGFRMAIIDQYFEAMMRKIQNQQKVNVSLNDPQQKQHHVWASVQNDKRIDHYLKQGYPIVTEKTGQNFRTIAQLKALSEKGGYQCFAVYVNTDPEVALKRNQNRPERSLSDPNELRKVHQQVLGNVFSGEKGPGVQGLFGNNFFVVDGNNLESVKKVMEEIINK